MPNVVRGVKARLAGDATLMSFVDGGVWDRPINRTETPDAFDTSELRLPKVSVTVLDGGELPERGMPGLAIANLSVWVRYPDAVAAEAKAQGACNRVMALLAYQTVEDPQTGECGMLEPTDRFPASRDPYNEGAKMTYVRFRVAGIASGVTI